LVVVDDAGTPSEPCTVSLDLRLQEGDLIFVRSGPPYSTVFDLGFYYWTHVGMYIGDQKMVEAIKKQNDRSPKKGVVETPLWGWGYPYETCAVALRVETDETTRKQAVAFAREKVGLPYDVGSILGDEKQLDGPSYYCSELIWMAYYKASGGHINLGNTAVDPFVFVSPDDIAKSSQVEEVGSHTEKVPFGIWPHFIWARARCPVDLIVTDPDGLRLTKQESQIPDALYEESDTDGDGDIDDCFVIPNAKPGQYLIQVVPEPNALPDETFSLEVNVDGEPNVLAQDVPIRSIPQEPYKVIVGRPLPDPVAHWTFDEGTGWIAHDIVGHNDAVVGGIKWTQGVLGMALTFDGVQNRVNCPNTAVLAPERLTITFWSTTSRRGAEEYIVVKGPAPNTAFDPDYVVSYSQDGRMKFCFGQNREQYIRVFSEPINDPNQWVHVAAVRDGSKALLYLNGKLVASTNYSFVPVHHDGYFLTFGAGSQFSCPLLGRLDDVRIYDKPLSAEEIQELYKQVSP
jgi:hypothetical protein